jgi:hypothetical protein
MAAQDFSLLLLDKETRLFFNRRDPLLGNGEDQTVPKRDFLARGVWVLLENVLGAVPLYEYRYAVRLAKRRRDEVAG